ncbi:MAG: helicase-related protein [Gammaproteobacteria bacterium]|nr:helicase-related protein [Gammaproteobacteria bacterium]MCY4340930.1 helicase-related protein [Gammaproteobacteria bacterium]
MAAKSENPPIRDGQILTGPLFSEPMLVETVRANGSESWVAGLVGTQTERFRRVALSTDDIADLTITGSTLSYDGDGRLLRLGLEAHALGIAHEFDPYFGLSISRVDPLPHQLEAVYGHLLKLSTVRFLLADDAGAGKTIMAGLLVRELMLRGLAERVLVVCPANLAFQWQRELREKFDEKFLVLKGSDIRDQFGVNQWMEQKRVITSLDLAKRDEILPGLRQAHWDLVIIDEAHRMSWSPPAKKTARYALGELLRDSADHILLLTATPHKGDPKNFTLFLQLLDQDAYADVKSIREAMNRRRAPFYLRRTKEAMVYFPERQPNGEWNARPVFTKRTPQTVDFKIDGDEHELYQEITRFVKRQSVRAAAQGDDPRARAVGFLMALYQRRLASSTHAMRRSLENRAKRLEDGLQSAQALARTAPTAIPDPEEIEEMEDADRERLEALLDAITLAGNAEQVREEIGELRHLARSAQAVEAAGNEAKLARLRDILQKEGFFDDASQRLLLFTEFKDTLNYLMERLRAWGFQVGCIHGGMKAGSRDEPGTRIHAEQQFREGEIQVLVATEAAGEGINLQCCHILFNYDIPWNPNRLEQRMGRIHRYGQVHDCLIFNFVATNTIEGRVLNRLLDKLQEIRDALDDDAVFNVVGEVLPAAQVERVLRDYYAGKLGDADLEDRMLKDVDEGRFRAICQTALEGLASKRLNLEMLVERRARAKEQRVVPENIARFMQECAQDADLGLKPLSRLAHTFDPGRTPTALKRYELAEDWKLPQLAARYPRLSTDRETADANHLEWVTPGHPLFEALRRHGLDAAQRAFARGACFYSLGHETPARLDVYRARIVDGLGRTINERLFAVELSGDGERRQRDPHYLMNLIPAETPDPLPTAASAPEATAWLMETALEPFLRKIRTERCEEIDRIAEHVELSLTEVLHRIDQEIGRADDDVKSGKPGAKGRLAQAETRHADTLARRDKRRDELRRERAVTLQGVERLASALILPHPERETPELKRLRPDPNTEMTAMRVVMDHEAARGCKVRDVHEQNLGYDITSLDPESGELRLIEIKGLAASTGTIILTPNERRVAEDRPDCYWLYVVTDCAGEPRIREPIRNPAKSPWREVTKVQHYWLNVDTITNA